MTTREKQLTESLAALLEICRWKCSPHDEVILSTKQSNHDAMIEAQRILTNVALDEFAEAGAKAWADVPDAAAWVRELRGYNGPDGSDEQCEFCANVRNGGHSKLCPNHPDFDKD